MCNLPVQQARKRQRGNAMLESALVLMAFMVVVIGVLDFSQFLFLHQALVERARSAARWGAINGPTNTSAIQNVVLYNSPTGSGTGYLGLQPSNVTVQTLGASTDDYRLEVRISNYQYLVLSAWIAGTYTAPTILVTVPLGLAG